MQEKDLIFIRWKSKLVWFGGDIGDHSFIRNTRNLRSFIYIKKFIGKTVNYNFNGSPLTDEVIKDGIEFEFHLFNPNFPSMHQQKPAPNLYLDWSLLG